MDPMPKLVSTAKTTFLSNEKEIEDLNTWVLDPKNNKELYSLVSEAIKEGNINFLANISYSITKENTVTTEEKKATHPLCDNSDHQGNSLLHLIILSTVKFNIKIQMASLLGLILKSNAYKIQNKETHYPLYYYLQKKEDYSLIGALISEEKSLAILCTIPSHILLNATEESLRQLKPYIEYALEESKLNFRKDSLRSPLEQEETPYNLKIQQLLEYGFLTETLIDKKSTFELQLLQNTWKKCLEKLKSKTFYSTEAKQEIKKFDEFYFITTPLTASEKLLNAAKNNNLKEFEAALKDPAADINIQDPKTGNTALHFAHDNNNDKMMELILSRIQKIGDYALPVANLHLRNKKNQTVKYFPEKFDKILRERKQFVENCFLMWLSAKTFKTSFTTSWFDNSYSNCNQAYIKLQPLLQSILTDKKQSISMTGTIEALFLALFASLREPDYKNLIQVIHSNRTEFKDCSYRRIPFLLQCRYELAKIKVTDEIKLIIELYNFGIVEDGGHYIISDYSKYERSYMVDRLLSDDLYTKLGDLCNSNILSTIREPYHSNHYKRLRLFNRAGSTSPSYYAHLLPYICEKNIDLFESYFENFYYKSFPYNKILFTTEFYQSLQYIEERISNKTHVSETAIKAKKTLDNFKLPLPSLLKAKQAITESDSEHKNEEMLYCTIDKDVLFYEKDLWNKFYRHTTARTVIVSLNAIREWLHNPKNNIVKEKIFTRYYFRLAKKSITEGNLTLLNIIMDYFTGTALLEEQKKEAIDPSKKIKLSQDTINALAGYMPKSTKIQWDPNQIIIENETEQLCIKQFQHPLDAHVDAKTKQSLFHYIILADIPLETKKEIFTLFKKHEINGFLTTNAQGLNPLHLLLHKKIDSALIPHLISFEDSFEVLSNIPDDVIDSCTPQSFAQLKPFLANALCILHAKFPNEDDLDKKENARLKTLSENWKKHLGTDYYWLPLTLALKQKNQQRFLSIFSDVLKMAKQADIEAWMHEVIPTLQGQKHTPFSFAIVNNCADIVYLLAQQTQQLTPQELALIEAQAETDTKLSSLLPQTQKYFNVLSILKNLGCTQIGPYEFVMPTAPTEENRRKVDSLDYSNDSDNTIKLESATNTIITLSETLTAPSVEIENPIPIIPSSIESLNNDLDSIIIPSTTLKEQETSENEEEDRPYKKKVPG